MRTPVLGLFLAVLAACSSEPEPVYSGRCPQAAIVSDTSKIVKYEGDGAPKPENVRVAAEVRFAQVDCRVDATGIDAALVLDIRAQIGPATREFDHVLPVFIAITDTSDRILVKKVVGSLAAFTSQNIIEYRDVIEGIRIPLAEGGRGDSYRILTGFQLSRAELAQNRERFGFKQ